MLPKHSTQAGRQSAPVAAAVFPGQSPIPEKSIAVLLFVYLSEKKDQEYFSDGQSEELIDLLTKVPDLRVPARIARHQRVVYSSRMPANTARPK